MSKQGANPNVYNYTPDDSLLVQFSGSRLRELTSQIGEELEPSIWLGEARYISHQCMSTVIHGLGLNWTGTKMTVEGYEHEVRNNRVFGLCRNYPGSMVTVYPINGTQAPIVSCDSLWGGAGTKRVDFNSERWTNKENLTGNSWDNYGFYPLTKLFKGGAVAYFQIVAHKEIPRAFNTYNDIFTWFNTSGNIWIGTPEDYEAVKETYPNVFNIQMFFKCGAQGGQQRNVTAVMFYPQNMKCTGLLLSMWDGSSFTEYYSSTDPRWPGQKMSYGVTPQSAEVINYYATSYIFKGFLNGQYASTSEYSRVPYGAAWDITTGLEGYRKWIDITTSDTDVKISYCTYPVDKLIDLATGLGFAATDSTESVAQNGNINTNDKIWTPTYNEQGYIDGKTNDQTEKTEYTDDGANGGFIQPNFDPYEDEEEEEYPDEDPSEDQKTPEIELPDVTLSSYGVFNRTYVLTKLLCQHLSDYLWNSDSTTFEDIIQDLRLVGDNVMNSIISVIMFPFEIPNNENSELIRIGRRTTTVYARPLITNNIVFDMGDCYCYAKFQNFLDYEPYTKAWLYIPFCGIFSVPLQQFMNKYIDIKLSVDLLTGAGQAIVYADGLPIIYKNCKIGMQIPVTGADSTYTVRNYISAAQSFLGAAGSFAAGNYLSAIGSTISAATAFISADNPPLQSEGSTSPQCGMLAPNRCYFIIERPKPRLTNVPDYGKLIGYACYKSGIILQFSGFSKFENVKLDISHCTDTERNEIISLLRSGVYL